MSTVLVVDDEKGIRDVLKDILEDEGHRVHTAEDGIEGLELLSAEPIDLVLLDIWLPNMGGMDVLREIKSRKPETEVIIISGHANIDLAVRAVKLGAFDFIEKPLSLDRVTTLCRNALEIEQLRQENRRLRSRTLNEDEMIGKSAVMKKVAELVEQSAASGSTIMVYGENGTGKELVARRIHRLSDRADGPFVEVNCAAIPDSLIESELFGHEKGAFTSAVGLRKGKFEVAHLGTLFLDEVADMSPTAQAKVLRAIQENRFERVGGEEPIQVDVRIIAATNKDIRAEIDSGRFREDLYFRLNVIWIDVPPLRERGDDVVAIAEYFVKKFRSSPDSPLKRFDRSSRELLTRHSWPGNVRELKNFIERISIMTDEEILTREIVEYYLGERRDDRPDPVLEEFADMSLAEARDGFERRYLEQKLTENDFNISRTATALGMYPSSLHAKIRKLGIKTGR
jgi:two-component system nitrogen regulation response regulator NtrX